MSQNALSNPSNTPASSRPEPKPNVSWNDPTQRAKGRQMLNQLAHSSPAILILQPFDILSNDWDSWWELLDGEERKKIPDTTLPEIDALLDSKWDETFPSFTHPKVRVMLRDLVSRFLFGGNRDRKVYSFWEETTFVELALFFWLIRRYPSDEVTYALGDWELDEIHKSILPFEDRGNLTAIIGQQEGNIRKVCYRLLRTIEEQGLTVERIFGDLVDPTTLAEFQALRGERTERSHEQ